MERDSNKRITLERFFRHPFLDNSYKRSIYCVPLGLLFEVEITEETKYVIFSRAFFLSEFFLANILHNVIG